MGFVVSTLLTALVLVIVLLVGAFLGAVGGYFICARQWQRAAHEKGFMLSVDEKLYRIFEVRHDADKPTSEAFVPTLGFRSKRKH